MRLEQVTERGGSTAGVVTLLVLATLMIAVAIWVLSNGFHLDAAMVRWTKVLATLGADEFAIENLSFLMPHLPLYLLMPFYYIPGLDSGAAPYVVSLLAAIFLLFLWDRNLRDVELSSFRHMILAVLLVMHPAFLWAATSGGHIALSMVVFYLLYRSAQYIITDHDLHSYIALAVVFLLFFFIDTSAIFIFIALIPLMVVIAPMRTIMVSPMGLYLVVGTPFAFAVFSWAYMNWIFEGSFTHFITHAGSLYLGGQMHIQDYPWLQDYGGQFFKSLFVVTGYLLVAYPVSIYLLLDTVSNNYRFRASFVLLLHPLIAIAIATEERFLTHPFEILALVSAGIMAELTFVKMQSRREFILLVLFMVVSVAGGWWLFIQSANPQMQQWLRALSGQPPVIAATQDGDLQLGLWLKKHRQPTMIYEESGYRVIAARGDIENLKLSFSHAFKVALRERVPGVKQVALPDPGTVRGRKDRLNLRHPDMYAHGLKGFRLVYDKLGWRVYRRIDA